MLLGQTIDGMRVWDVRRAIQTLRTLDSARDVPMALEGKGPMAGIVLYASLFEPDITRLDLWHLPDSHRDGPAFLNVLRYLDVPQAVAMAAERGQIRLYQEDDSGWRFPQAVAEKLGWPKDKFQVHIVSIDNPNP
jgi:acyl-homoserine lactone acylase PvdQ